MKAHERLVSQHHKRGFSLVEVLVFTAILGIFFVNAAFVVTVTLHRAKFNEHKILATRYAEELMEWVRGQKDANWSTFVTHSNADYCFNTTPIPGWTNDCNNKINNIYTRHLTLTSVDNNTVTVAIQVSWQDGSDTFNVPLNTTFTVWEQQ